MNIEPVNDNGTEQIQEREAMAIEDRSLPADQVLGRTQEPGERPALFIP